MKIVLTAGRALMSDYNGTSYMGFVSALPASLIGKRLEKVFFPTYSDENGHVLWGTYSILKIESSLIKAGFSRDEVIVADPTKLDRVIGEDTKAIGITCMDPLGVGYGSGIVYMAMMLYGIIPKGRSYMSKSFLDVINHPNVKKYKPKIIVGGEASWQIIDLNMQEKLSIDTAVLGEGEKVAPELFKKAVKGEDLPKFVNGVPVNADEIPPILTPSIGGLVEITRGCGRGCKFCTPTLLKFRSIPLDTILRETEFNLQHGAKTIGLHSEDFLRYGSKTLIPEEDKILNLFENVQRFTKKYDAGIGVDFVTAACTMSKPKLAEKVGNEYVNVGGKKSFIEMGIETGSPRLINLMMPGKVLPYKAEQYPEMVEQAIGILNDSGWTVVGTLITELPEENEYDVIKTIELIDNLKNLEVIPFVLPFIPMGQFRGREFTVLKNIVLDDLRRELFLKSLDKVVSQIKKDTRIVTSGITKSMLAKLALEFALWYMGKKIKKLEKMDHKEFEELVNKLEKDIVNVDN